MLVTVTKTCMYNFDPLKPHFYIVKLGFTGVYITFLISAQKHRLWVLVEAVLTSTHNLCFEQKYEKNIGFFLSENFQFLLVNFSVYLNRRDFVMHRSYCRFCSALAQIEFSPTPHAAPRMYTSRAKLLPIM